KGNAGFIGIRAPYYVSYILPQLLQRYGENVLYKGGLRVYTTLDLDLQAQAEAAIRQGIDAGLKANAHQGAMVVLDPQTGAIRAMIGGKVFRSGQFTSAWQATHTTGSASKPVTYTPAPHRATSPTTTPHVRQDKKSPPN